MAKLQIKIHTTQTSVMVAASLMLAVSATAMFFSLGMMAAGFSLSTTQNPSNEISSSILLSQEKYGIELDLPEYLDESLRHPQKFFSGDKIRIIDKHSDILALPNAITLSSHNRNEITKQISLEVIKKRKKYFSVIIPKNISSGFYTIDIELLGSKYYLPIEIDGITSGGGGASPIIGEINPDIMRMNCGYCWWEATSAVNPANVDIGYIVSGGSSMDGREGDVIIYTGDGWDTFSVFHINEIIDPSFIFY